MLLLIFCIDDIIYNCLNLGYIVMNTYDSPPMPAEDTDSAPLPSDNEKIHRRLYIPFPAAILERVLNPNRYTPRQVNEAASIVASGKIPDRAGLVVTGKQEELGAFDFVDVRNTGDLTFILPTSKRAVESSSHRILRNGFIVFTLGDIIKLVAKSETHGSLSRTSRVDMRMFGYDAPVKIIEEVDSTGLIIASDLRHYHRFPDLKDFQSNQQV